jgi:diguanylate cyclase (GGDEF)-like protein/PAS domain S-box-containing protein
MQKGFQRFNNKKGVIFQAKWKNSLRYLLQVSLLAIIYYALASFGLFLEGGQRGAMPIPLPAGIALAALLVFGTHLWPGIVIGLMAVKFQMDVPLLFTSFDAAGAALQAVAGAWLLQRFGFQATLSRVFDVLLFAVIVMLISPLSGASVSAAGLLYSQVIPHDYIGQIWVTNWFSDGAGMLILTSGLLVWRQLPPVTYHWWRWLEWAILLLCLAIVTGLTLKVDYGNRLMLLYLILPFAVWGAVRFEQHGATLGALLIAGILLNGGLNRIYPMGESAGTPELLLEIGFIAVTSVTAYLVAAAYSERRQAEENLFREKELAITTLHSIADGVITTNDRGRITYLNPIAEELTGWSSLAVIGKPTAEVFLIKSTAPNGALENPVIHGLRGIVSLPRQSFLINRDRQEIPIENSAAPIRNRDGQIEGVIIVFHDVSKEYQLREQLSHQATHDALTGLSNRREFEYQLSNLLNNAKTEGKCHSLLYLDLDQFKIVNDTCGHIAGDALLKQLVTVIQSRVRGSDTFARLGGDEFGILLKNCPLERTALVAEAYLNTVRGFRFIWDNKTFEVGVSIGAIPITAQSESVATLLSQADIACYAAKEEGRNRVHVHTGGEEKTVAVRQREMHWVGRILKAIEENRIVLYRQPIVAVERHLRTAIHYEILIRMRDEQGAIVPPGSFLPAAERYDLMPRIDRWVCHKVFTHLAEQQRTHTSHEFVAINLSGVTLNDPSFAQFIRDELTQLNVPTDTVCFEVTETAAISSLDKAAGFIRDMNQLGFRFALDDFGSGVSSFGYLKQLPVTYLKIDGSFVKDMVTDPIDRAIVESITQIGHAMNLKIIAEWVENDATLAALNLIGVDFAQGYGIAKPEPFL